MNTTAEPIIDNIPRVHVNDLNPEEFYEKFQARHNPVVLVGSQDCSPVGKLTDKRSFIAAHPDMMVEIQKNYTADLARRKIADGDAEVSSKVSNTKSQMTLGDYFHAIQEPENVDLLCVEFATPEVLLTDMNVGRLSLPHNGLAPEVSFLFVANAGNYAHLHFDGDYRDVILYQVFGRKRIVMIPKEQIDLVNPTLHHSGFLLQNMTSLEKSEFIRMAGGYETVLNPGEAVYFPASVWHYVEYLDDGLSINFRFKRSEWSSKVVDANAMPFYPELHLLVSLVERMEEGSDKTRMQERVWNTVNSFLRERHDTAAAQHASVQRGYRMLLQDSGLWRENLRHTMSESPEAASMAVERLEDPVKAWRTELRLGPAL